jgi:hypothetical protein
MTHVPGPPAQILQGLAAALAGSMPYAGAVLVPLPDRGLAHWHVRLAHHGVLARIPKQSQVGLPAEANLRHQQACFERAAASGHTPRLHAVLPVSAGLPRGALLVEEIHGRQPVLPRDLTAIAEALAALHACALPGRGDRPPLPDEPDPLQAMATEVLAQAQYVPGAGVAGTARKAVEEGTAMLKDLLSRPDRPARRLIAFDAHPGNFLIRGGSDAVLVDLEKCRYSYPGFDLAHASLYTSTTWEAASQATLSVQEVVGFYDQWAFASAADLAGTARPWHLRLRHAMWLWSLTWCCKWRVLSRRPSAPQTAEDWSAGQSDAALVAHVGERVSHYLSPGAVARVQSELKTLERLLA